ncbi:MAG: imidazole glycerol phosphate synthase subunit HisH [Alphaproteobacteria bacterium]|nr:imidazole glycerol phosphate synthase subunit HisH [Alphaproteobacteria bacterium]MBV9692095.1 imidazole glycerol phosphate synthase subunit HisH [Alphaproteobacteria bacterium]
MSVLALIDCGSGNLRSAAKALERADAEVGSRLTVKVTADPHDVAAADRIVLPGVGAFADCMQGLAAVPGLVEALEESVLGRGVPFLGICVGMQLLATVGREFGDHRGLDWIAGEVVPLSPDDPACRIPHIGWNGITPAHPHPLFRGIANEAYVYFVHSFVMRPCQLSYVLATADYGGSFTAAVGRDNIAGVQFHPEKSQSVGLAILGNFLRWRP